MPLVKPSSPSLQLAHRLAKGLVGAWVMPEGAGLRSRDSSPSRLDTTFAGSTPPTWAIGPVIAYNVNAYSTLLVNTIPASVPTSYGTIGAVGSAYTIVSRIITTNAAAISITAPWSFGGCLFEARNTGASAAHAWSVGVESGRWGTARTNNVGTPGGQRILSATTLVNDNVWHDVAAVVNGNNVSLYIDGRLDTNSIFNNAFSTGDCSISTGVTNAYAQIGARTTNAAGYASGLTGSVAFCYVYNRALSRDEISALASDPFQAFRAPSRAWLGSIPPSITGVLDTTLRPAALYATGRLPIAGAALATLAPATLDATGTAAAHGALDVTLTPATLSATGTAAAHGALSATLTPATLDATVTLQVLGSGALDVALQPTVLTATGIATAHGALSATLTPATLDAVGVLTLSGKTAVTLRPAALDAVGALALTGSVTATLQEAALDAVAALTVTGDLQTDLLPATLEATAIVLAGLIGERATIAGSRAPVVALTGNPSLAAITGSRRRPVALTGNSEMVKV